MKKEIAKLIAMILICILTVGCGQQVAEIDADNNFNEAQEQNKPAEIVTAQVKVEYGADFSVEYLEGGVKKLVDGEGRTILVVPEGAKVPEGAEADEILKLPVKNIVACSSTFVSLMRPLDLLDRVKGVTTPQEDWFIDEIKDGLGNGEVMFVGGGSMGEPDYELVQALNPDLVMVYTGAGGQFAHIAKFEELDISYVVINDYTENDPLARLEWVKFLAAIFNVEEKANSFFTEVEATINAVSKKVAGAKQPKIAWCQIYEGTVFTPKGGSYVAKQIAMAGGDYAFKDLEPDQAGSAQLTVEAYFAGAVDADIFIYDSMGLPWITNIPAIIELAPALAEINPIVQGNAWAFQPWYYQALDKTHEQIEDLAAIFYPEFYPDHQVRHYLWLPRE